MATRLLPDRVHGGGAELPVPMWFNFRVRDALRPNFIEDETSSISVRANTCAGLNAHRVASAVGADHMGRLHRGEARNFDLFDYLCNTAPPHKQNRRV